MNYICLLLEVLLVFIFMILFYKHGKKDGLYIYLGLMSSILSVILIGSINILSFQISIGIPIIVGLFICSNIIIQRYGIDEVKRILYTHGISYIVTFIIVSLVSLTFLKELDISNNVYDLLFGYGLNNVRCIIGNFISIMIMLWIGSGIYYSFRKNKNILAISNIVTAFVISFVESLIFVLISYIGNFTAIELFGMISVRYIIHIIIVIIGIIPIYILVKFMD